MYPQISLFSIETQIGLIWAAIGFTLGVVSSLMIFYRTQIKPPIKFKKSQDVVTITANLYGAEAKAFLAATEKGGPLVSVGFRPREDESEK